jgi:hypothetical protein
VEEMRKLAELNRYGWKDLGEGNSWASAALAEVSRDVGDRKGAQERSGKAGPVRSGRWTLSGTLTSTESFGSHCRTWSRGRT